MPQMPALSLPKRPAGRISLAIGLSLLIHAIVLFAPQVELPPSEVPLPPLAAKLEVLPKIPPGPAPVKKPMPKPQPAPPEKTVPETIQADDSPVEGMPQEEPQIDPEPQPPGSAEAAPETQPPPPLLPRHAQLTFIAYKGTDLVVGEARHNLDFGDDDSYTLKVSTNTTGLVRFFKTFDLNQHSSGTLTEQGLRPAEYSEMKNSGNDKEQVGVKFHWAEKTLSFSNGRQTQLPEQTQDIVSFLYQLSRLPLGKGTVPLYITNGKKLERYELTVGEEEYIQTRFGRLRALPLRKVHAQGEEGLDIWLGLEYRLLPVKVRQINRDGQIAGEMAVSDIRVSDESHPAAQD
ncbi:MAG: DUF3108 domain-containing protein [Nitrosomonadales bacterium]|nr:DUF3108 domain-containing protein [Nitrosomonadales bacterium]